MGEHYIKTKDGYLPMKGKVILHQGHEFFVHRSVLQSFTADGTYDCHDGKYFVICKGYCISHLRTGIKAYSTRDRYDTRKHTIETFPGYITKNMNTFCKDKTFSQFIHEMIKESGLTPEFDEKKESLVLHNKIIER